jgi:hypothetical protein
MSPVFLAVLARLAARFRRISRKWSCCAEVDPVAMLRRDARLGLQSPGRWSPNGHCQLVPAQDGWLAVNLARPDDAATVPAWLGTSPDESPWPAVQRVVPTLSVEELLPGASLLHMPISRAGEALPAWPVLRLARPVGLVPRPLQVVDLSALWAGPLAGGLLAQTGAAVIKVESPSRPDPSPQRTPDLDRRLNGLKQRKTLAMTDPAITHLIDSASVLITSGRPHALARAGLDPERLFSRNPRLLWVAITSHGATGEQAMRVGFGDDCAAAGGLLMWEDGIPTFMGDALADPCCGIMAATAALECLAEGQAGLLDVSLAGCAAWIADAMAKLQ